MTVVEWVDRIVGLPAEYLKAVGTVLGGALLAAATYVVARIRESRKAPEAAALAPRLALDPVDRDLGFTLVRTATDLTRALNDHAEALAALGPPACAAPPAPPPHRTRARRPSA